jgi:NAD(P)-dependent dehydrogenase (short-subunit alcohol dehydrogenase family)
MAHISPPELTVHDVATDSERKVFEILAAQLDDSWHVFHSLGWVTRDAVAGAEDGEVDFVLCQAAKGVLCLEVKGGGIESRHGRWSRIEPNGDRVPIRDPFRQALDHRYALTRLIEEAGGPRDLLIGHAVVFPFITIHQLSLAPDAPVEILLDRKDLDNIAPSVERVLDYHRGARDKRRPPGDRGVKLIRQRLIPEVCIRVPMAARFLDEEEELIRLTNEQALLLRRLQRNPRMVITGCAGSGKTMIAVEHAKRLVARGQRVLFVCFNRALRDHLRATEGTGNPHFQTFHSLCVELANRAKIRLPKHDGDPPQAYWEDELPDALVAAIEELGAQYDALVVDEAQDLHTHWLTALMATLGDEQRNPVWLFMDDNQRVYDAELDVAPEFQRFDLTVNCRNTQAIHREVMKLYDGEIEPEVKGPPGRNVELVRTSDQAAAVAGVIRQLCEQEEVMPQDIVVLSSHSLEGSKVGRNAIDDFRFTKERGKLGKYVQFSSIRAFKGLESPVVILCELEDLDEMTQDHQLYVGLSRARNHCVVVAPDAPN